MGNGAAGGFGESVVCPALIGRAGAVHALSREVDGVEGGHGRVILVAGEAGMGKSRLVAEAKAHATEHGYLVLQGVCFPQDRACPYAPLLDLLRGRFAGEAHEGIAAAVGPFADELYPLLPDLVPRPANPLLTTDPEQERRRLYTVLAQCLADHSGRPVLVVVEDLHWCDSASLDFLLYLARHAASRSLVLLGTYRREDAEPPLQHWLAQLDRERLARELALTPLSREEVAAMLAAIFGPDPSVPVALLEAIQDLAEGNPFCVEEFLKATVVADDIASGDGADGLDLGPAAQWRIPRSLHDAVRQRVLRLSAGAREVLTLAAVVGRRFDFGLLR